MRRFVSSVALVVALLVGFARPAAASTPTTATGTFGFVPISLTLIGTAGGNSFFASQFETPYSGDLTGTATDTETDIVRSDGSFTGHGTEVCTSCTLGGRVGGYTAVFAGTGSNFFTTDLPFQGRLTFVRGTGGLAGLRGGGTFEGDASGNTSYSYNYSFTP